MVNARQVDGSSLASLDLRDLVVVVLQTANTNLHVPRLQEQGVSQRGGAGRDASGHHRAVAGHGKDPVDGHSERARQGLLVVPGGHILGGLEEFFT